jgi:hypothetical protein
MKLGLDRLCQQSAIPNPVFVLAASGRGRGKLEVYEGLATGPGGNSPQADFREGQVLPALG